MKTLKPEPLWLALRNRDLALGERKDAIGRVVRNARIWVNATMASEQAGFQGHDRSVHRHGEKADKAARDFMDDVARIADNYERLRTALKVVMEHLDDIDRGINADLASKSWHWFNEARAALAAVEESE